MIIVIDGGGCNDVWNWTQEKVNNDQLDLSSTVQNILGQCYNILGFLRIFKIFLVKKGDVAKCEGVQGFGRVIAVILYSQCGHIQFTIDS